MSEEALLQADTVIGVEMREVGIAVHFQPFLFRAGGEIAFEIAAGVQALTAPIRSREERHVDPAELGHARAVIVVDRLAAQSLGADIGAIAGERLLRQRLMAGYRIAGDRTSGPAFPDAILHARDLPARPVLQEVAENAAMAGQLPVIVG